MSSVGWRGVLIGGGAFASSLIPFVMLAVTESATGDSLQGASVHTRRPLAELIADGRARGTVLLCASVFLILLVSYFLVSWTPTVLTLSGASEQHAAMAGVMLNLGGLAGALALSVMIGRQSPTVAVAGCLCVGSLLIVLLGYSVAAGLGLAFALVFAIGLLVIGAQMNIPALCVHYYPAPVCATGVGLSMAIGRLGSIAGPLIGGCLLSARMAWDRLFLLAAIPALLAGIGIMALAGPGKPRAVPADR
jgi:AAHS family 4-hydroxybenzoate transporter-like MFS transporter